MTRDDHIEQQICDLVDGTLGPADAARIHALLASDSAARELHDRYVRLQSVLRRWRTLPVGAASRDWSGLLRQKIEDDVVRLMSEYEAGTLSADEARQVARRFATDAAAARVGRELQQTQDLLEAWAGPLPPVDWKATHSRFSAAVRNEAARTRRRRIAGWAATAALAACVGLAAILGWRFATPNIPTPSTVEPVKMVHAEVEQPSGAGKAVARFDSSAPEGFTPLTPTSPSRSAALRPVRPRAATHGSDDVPN